MRWRTQPWMLATKGHESVIHLDLKVCRTIDFRNDSLLFLYDLSSKLPQTRWQKVIRNEFCHVFRSWTSEIKKLIKYHSLLREFLLASSSLWGSSIPWFWQHHISYSHHLMVFLLSWFSSFPSLIRKLVWI